MAACSLLTFSPLGKPWLGTHPTAAWGQRSARKHWWEPTRVQVNKKTTRTDRRELPYSGILKTTRSCLCTTTINIQQWAFIGWQACCKDSPEINNTLSKAWWLSFPSALEPRPATGQVWSLPPCSSNNRHSYPHRDGTKAISFSLASFLDSVPIHLTNLRGFCVLQLQSAAAF